jgi:hypothetical protein
MLIGGLGKTALAPAARRAQLARQRVVAGVRDGALLRLDRSDARLQH